MSCDQVSHTRALRYSEFDRNFLDIAIISSKDATVRPVLLFVAGKNFSGDGRVSDVRAHQDEAMCFATRQGMVGVTISYRRAPAPPGPASWIHQNLDLFGGNAQGDHRDRLCRRRLPRRALSCASRISARRFRHCRPCWYQNLQIERGWRCRRTPIFRWGSEQTGRSLGAPRFAQRAAAADAGMVGDGSAASCPRAGPSASSCATRLPIVRGRGCS